MAAEICRQEEFEGVVLNVIEEDGQDWINAEDIGKGLGFAQPRTSIMQIFHRNREDFEGLSRVVKTRERTKTGGFRPHRFTVFNAEAVVIFGFFANTSKARTFRQWASRVLATGIYHLRDQLLKLREDVLKLEAANRKLLEKSRVKALPGPEYGHKDQIKTLEKQLKETKKAAMDIIDTKTDRIRILNAELYQAQQQAKIRPLLMEGRHRRLQRHLYKMLEELGSVWAVVVELAEHLQEK